MMSCIAWLPGGLSWFKAFWPWPAGEVPARGGALALGASDADLAGVARPRGELVPNAGGHQLLNPDQSQVRGGFPSGGIPEAHSRRNGHLNLFATLSAQKFTLRQQAVETRQRHAAHDK
jgi:hypothetical protein